MMRKFSLSALVATGMLVGGLSVGSASAADLGGNCCADLEERIAELEATTARKGNRKVSLTISGWVGEQVLWWDDGSAKGTYVTGLGTTLASHVTFSGQATIMPGWYAGYVLQLEMNDSDPLITLSQNVSTGPNEFVVGLAQTFYSYWFVKSDHLGKVSVGLQSSAADNAAILVDGSGSLVPANWVTFDFGNFFLRGKNGATTNFTWNSLGFCNVGGGASGDCVGIPQNLVRYDSPTWYGFSLSADWGQDSYWDVYGRYSGEWNGIKLAAVSGWSAVNGCKGSQDFLQKSVPPGGISGFTGTTCLNSPGVLGQGNFAGDVGYWQSGIYVEHVATGVWALFNYGKEFLQDMPPGAAGLAINDNPDHLYVKAGLRERWSQLGHSVLYGFWGRRNDMISGTDVTAFNVTGARTDEWGLGAVQEIDAAAMSLWIQWDEMHANVQCGPGGCTSVGEPAVENGVYSLKNINIIKSGALINF